MKITIICKFYHPLLLLIILLSQSPVSALTVPEGLEIPINFVNPVNSSEIKAQDHLEIVVSDDVSYEGTVYFKRATKGETYVDKAKGAGGWGNSGYLEIGSGRVSDKDGVEHNFSLDFRKGQNISSIDRTLNVIGSIIIIPMLFYAFVKGDQILIQPTETYWVVVD